MIYYRFQLKDIECQMSPQYVVIDCCSNSYITLDCYAIQHSIMIVEMNEFEIKKISYDEAFERMKKAGMDVTYEEAVLILDFLHGLTYLVLKKYFKLK